MAAEELNTDTHDFLSQSAYQRLEEEHATTVINDKEESDTHIKSFTSSSRNFEESEELIASPNWLMRNALRLSVGALAISGAVTAVTQPYEGLVDKLQESAPWVVGGVAASETIFAGGVALALAGLGKRVGNPLQLRARWQEIKSQTGESKTFKAGIIVNTVGAIGTPAVIAAGTVAALPAELWPGAMGIAAADIASTVAIRRAIFKGFTNTESEASLEKIGGRLRVRKATHDDIDRLADIDIALFEGAYGEKIPTKDEVAKTFHERLDNAKGWMFVAEVDGNVEGFATAFRTNKPIEEFASWEDTTADGTLDGRVDPNGKYAYVVNLTMNHAAMELEGETAIFANLFANGIRDGLEYGYFVSRVPQFKEWFKQQVAIEEVPEEVSKEEMFNIATKYVSLTREKNGRQSRYDYLLRLYEEAGFKPQRVVADAFDDDASMNYGVVFKADVPPANPIIKRIKPLRHVMAAGLRILAKKPKLLNKVM